MTDSIVEKIIDTTKKSKIYENTQFIIFSEYSFNDVNGAIPINIILRNNGLLNVRKIGEKEYVDFECSKVIAVVDHQIANIYLKSPQDKERIVNILKNISDIDIIITEVEKKSFNIDHERAGDIIVVANRDKWFSYYWWYDENMAPSFTKTVDIHRKPGYDHLDLFIDSKHISIQYDSIFIKLFHW